MRRPLTTVIGLVLLFAPTFLLAQDSATTATPVPPARPAAQEFRAGQWAAEFGSYSGFYGIGALRFTSPNAAWSLAGEFHFDDQGENDPTRSTRLGVDIGRRWYGPLKERVRTVRSLGIFSSLIDERFPNGPDIQTNHEVVAGAFAELGAQVFVIPELSIGATWRAQAFYSRLRRELDSGPEYTNKGVQLTAGSISVVGALYF